MYYLFPLAFQTTSTMLSTYLNNKSLTTQQILQCEINPEKVICWWLFCVLTTFYFLFFQIRHPNEHKVPIF